MLLSVIIPVYNERGTLREILKKVEAAPLPKGVRREILLIDDGSTDGTRDILAKLPKRMRVLLHKKNKGKGGAVKTGFKHAKGDVFLIQDADLEYDPRDYTELIAPIMKGADVVYGSRMLGKDSGTHSSMAFFFGGLLVTTATNILFFSRLTDEPTCYKVFRKEVIRSMTINGNRFNWEPEITAKILKKGIKIHELPIRYYPRNFEEGKKIGWRDGVSALWTLLKYRFVN